MESHEKEKRGKLAELMYELLDFGRLEQLARDIWDKAPEGVRAEVAVLFANRVKAEIQRQADWSEPQVHRLDGDYNKKVTHPARPLMQLAFEKVANEAVEQYMKEHGDEIRAQLIAQAREQAEERLKKESAYVLDRLFSSIRTNLEKALSLPSKY